MVWETGKPSDGRNASTSVAALLTIPCPTDPRLTHRFLPVQTRPNPFKPGLKPVRPASDPIWPVQTRFSGNRGRDGTTPLCLWISGFRFRISFNCQRTFPAEPGKIHRRQGADLEHRSLDIPALRAPAPPNPALHLRRQV